MSSHPSINTLPTTAAGSHNDLNMVNPSMPELSIEHDKAPLKDSLANLEENVLPRKNKFSTLNLRVQIPQKKIVAIVEIPNPAGTKPISLEYHVDYENRINGQDFWKRCTRAQVRASHPSFSNKYTIKIELFDKYSQSLGILESGLHHNPGNYCFFCLDYFPENYHIQKDLKISCIAPYCSCFPKHVYEADANSKKPTQRIGQIKSLICSDSMDIQDKEGKLLYNLKTGNGLLRKFRFLVEVPCLMFCIPYKLALCCCIESVWSGSTSELKLSDYDSGQEDVIGTSVNKVETTNEWQEVIKEGQKISQYKGEETFLFRQFEVNLPNNATDEAKKLIIGALITELPSTIDRCAC